MQEGPKEEGHADAAGEGGQEHPPEAEQHRPRPLRQMVNTYTCFILKKYRCPCWCSVGRLFSLSRFFFMETISRQNINRNKLYCYNINYYLMINLFIHILPSSLFSIEEKK